MSFRHTISPFDRTVWATIAILLALITTLLIWSIRQQMQASPSDAPAILYSTVDDAGFQQLFLLPLTPATADAPPLTGENQQLTDSTGAIWDYSVAPDGSRIVYSELGENGRSDLWQIDTASGQIETMLDCAPSLCNGPSWSVDGRLLGFSLRSGAGLLSPPRPWLLDIASGQTAPVLNDDQQLGSELRWSADGRWVAYLSPLQGEIGLLDLEDSDERFFPSSTGEPVTWHPQAARFLYNQMTEGEESLVMHLMLADPTRDDVVNISGDDTLVEDRSPAWSPDGEWIAFRRKELTGPGATRGSQLWLMGADGSEPRPLTVNPDVDHGPPHWSPDGNYLLYQQTPLTGPNFEISLWLLEIESGELWELARPAQRPRWIPASGGQ